MTSDSFTSKMKSKLPSFSLFQTVLATQGDGSQSGRPTNPFKTISRSSTNVITAGSAEPQGDHVAGHISSLGDSSPTTQPCTVNVVLFGETGVGKSSVINLIARKDVAKVSSDVNGCTLQSTRYDILFDDMNFAIFDTIGLEEPQMGVNGYLKAIERAYELVVKLGAAGGIHLLLFCMRGGRITATTQSNYRLFCECLCNTRVPMALVFTGLEREVEMEDWWTRNKTHIEHYGIKSDGHACITAVQDDTPGEDLKYTESQRRIRELLKTCALKNEAFLPEPHTWFGKVGRGMRSFIEKHRNPKRKDVMKVLMNRCKLDPDTARKIADMMEKDDVQTKDGNPDEQAGAAEGETRSNPEPRADDKDEVVKENSAKDDGPPNQLDDIKAESRIAAMVGEDQRKVPKKKAAVDDVPQNQPGDIKVESRISVMEGEDPRKLPRRRAAIDDSLQNQLGDVKAESRIAAMEGEDRRKVAKKQAAVDDVLQNQPGDIKTESRISVMEGEDLRKLARKRAAIDDRLQNRLGDVKAESRISSMEREDQRKFPRKRAMMIDHGLQNQVGEVKAESRTSVMEGEVQRKLMKKRTAKDDDAVEAEPRIDRGNDGGQHMKHGSVGDQPLGAVIAEQAKQNDTNKFHRSFR